MDRHLARVADEVIDGVHGFIAEIEKLEGIIEELTSDIDELDNINSELGIKFEDLLLENDALRHTIINLEKDLAELAKTVESLI